MAIKIALAGNPNSGKTTLFNALTGSNQFVGNWPGVTVEKKEGIYIGDRSVSIVDLPGIYSLSPYTLEEVVAREFLIGERPDAILNIIDGTNLERNLYLTTQLLEIGVPMAIAVNMTDILEKRGDVLDLDALKKELDCPVVEISALRGKGVQEAAKAAIEVARTNQIPRERHNFSGSVEHAIAHIEELVLHDMPEEQQRWYAIKLFERDVKVQESLGLTEEKKAHIENDIQDCEEEMDDDAESIITNERYTYIASIIGRAYKKRGAEQLSTTDKIDRVVTNRWLALPIFALVMFVVYYVSVSTVGAWLTDWTNDNLFGNGFHLFGNGSAAYEEAVEEYAVPGATVNAFEAAAAENGVDPETATTLTARAKIYDDQGYVEREFPVNYTDYESAKAVEEPDPTTFGTWVPGIPVLIERGLDAVGTASWLKDLVLNGIVAGVGAVLGFVPQMLVLFLFLAFLEGCGYMARIAFIMDRIFRRFGLSGKSFIPMLIGTGCSVPGIMASRTIENQEDRRMTIITTSFIPCSAKLPIIALIAGALFGRAWWVAPSAYFIGVISVLVSGIILKKTKLFSGDPAPFVMELPAYHMPTIRSLLSSMWERGSSFIKRAGTVILLSSMVLWFLSGYGLTEGGIGPVDMDSSFLAAVGKVIAPIFVPVGFGSWQQAVGTITGLVAKENVVGTFGVLYGGFDEVAENGWQIWQNMRLAFTPLSAYSFLVFNLLCAPCFASMGAIRREMAEGKWTFFAIAYQTVFAFVISLIIYQLGSWIFFQQFGLWTIVAIILLVALLYLLFRPTKKKALLQEA